jgi:conjugative transfer signal peptidase TraF
MSWPVISQVGTSAASRPRRRKRALTKREKVSLVAGVGFIIVFSFAAVAVARTKGFWINTTDSMPMGLWRQTAPHEARPGDVALLCLPDTPVTKLGQARGYIAPGACPTGQEILLKPIAAGPGDLVDLSPSGVSVNGREIVNSAQLAHDSMGRPLPGYPAGQYRVPTGEVWLVSSHNPRSFDSRYFGPVSASLVQSTVRPVWVTD